MSEGSRLRRAIDWAQLSPQLTSKLCAYQRLTFSILGILCRPCGSSSSSFTRCANRIGNSAARNCEARRSVP